MGLLQQIQDGAVSNAIDLSEVLRRCMILAYKLGHEPFRLWVEQELNGYQRVAELPSYRIVAVELCGDFNNGFYRVTSGSLSWEVLPEEVQEDARTISLIEGVAELEALKDREDLRFSVSSRVRYYASRSLANGYVLTDLWHPVSNASVKGVLSAVRNRIVEFALSIEAELSDVDVDREGPMDPTPIPNEKLDRLVQVIIMGQGHAINLGRGYAVIEQIERQVVAGNLASLRRYLSSQGVADGDLNELEEIILDASVADIDDKRSKLREWIDRVTGNVTKGGIELAKTATREAILLTVRYYFGEIAEPEARNPSSSPSKNGV